ncbi:uncharacterized protein RSE6_05065 [Rhynchosporium secalis]|uniref:Uncharacterized protein n=1 Tax=Rhynchosporium secalis TaxID=38038 RepID=A0A1E1M6W8_RHYSE|nr:uncharacterized protein RSE6_05065 [Rhynchosporium secalis]
MEKYQQIMEMWLPGFQQRYSLKLEATDVQMQLTTLGRRLNEISTGLNDAVVSSSRETIDKLEIAMSKVYKIAVFLRGDYDARDVDDEHKKARGKKDVIDPTVLAFAEMQARAEEGLRQIGNFHSQVMEIQNTGIAPVKQKITQMIEQNITELESIQNQINTAETSCQNMQQSLKTQTDAVQSLEKKIAESETAATFSDVGFSILTFGIGNLINHGPLDPFNLHGELDDARRRYSDAVSSLKTAKGRLTELCQSKATLESSRATHSQLQVEIPSLQTEATITESRCIMLQNQFSVLKDTSTKLDLKVRKVQGDALVTRSTAYSKDEFVAGLLEICTDALIHSRLMDEVQMIKGEIFAEYGGPIPDEIAEAGYAVEEKLKMRNTLPSIKARL